VRPHDRPRMARGQAGSLFLTRMISAITGRVEDWRGSLGCADLLLPVS